MKKTSSILNIIMWILIIAIPIILGVFFYTNEYTNTKKFCDSYYTLPISNLFVIAIIYLFIISLIKIAIEILKRFDTLEHELVMERTKREGLEKNYTDIKLDLPIHNKSFAKINYLLESFTKEWPFLFCIQLYSFNEYINDKEYIVEISHTEYSYCRPLHIVNSINELYKIRDNLVKEYNEVVKIIINDPSDPRINVYVEKIVKRIKDTNSTIDDSKVFLFTVLILILTENINAGNYFSLSDIPNDLQTKIAAHKKMGFLMGIFSIKNKVQYFSYQKDGEKKRRNYLCKKVKLLHKNYLFMFTLNGNFDLEDASDISNNFCEFLTNELSN